MTNTAAPRRPLNCVFVAPDPSWIVVRDSDGFRVSFLESDPRLGLIWRDAGFGVFPTCAAAVAAVADL